MATPPDCFALSVLGLVGLVLVWECLKSGRTEISPCYSWQSHTIHFRICTLVATPPDCLALSVLGLVGLVLVWECLKSGSTRISPCYSVFFCFLFFFVFFCVPQLYISGVHHFWVRFLRMWPFFNPTIKVVTFHLHGWCVLGVFLLPAFTRLGHERQDLLSPCDEMHVCTD